MKLHRPRNNTLKLVASFAVLIGLSSSVALWLLAQLGDMSALAAGASSSAAQARADYAEVRLFVIAALVAMLGTATLLALWLRVELRQPPQNARRADQSPRERRAAAPDMAATLAASLAVNVATTMRARAAAEQLSRRTPQAPGPALGKLRLISSNPNPLRSERSERRHPTHIVAVNPGAVRTQAPTMRWAAARQEFSWE